MLLNMTLPKDFNWITYLDANPDLKTLIPNRALAEEHFLKYGSKEGRSWKSFRKTFEKVNPEISYLTLLKNCLLDKIYAHELTSIAKVVERDSGLDWPKYGHTMIGRKRLDNLEMACLTVLEEKIPGDFVECGIWRGGASILMRGVLSIKNCHDRIVYVVDSFEGLPPPNPLEYPSDQGWDLYLFSELAVGLDEVAANFLRYGLLDDQVQFVKGWFKDTLPNLKSETISVLRLDGDLYESTIDILNNLYSKVSIGGFIIVDDYGAIEACANAINDFRRDHSIGTPLQIIDHSGVYWRKE